MLVLTCYFGVMIVTQAQSLSENNFKNLISYPENISVNSHSEHYKSEDPGNGSEGEISSDPGKLYLKLKIPIYKDSFPVFRTKVDPLPSYYWTPNNIRIDCVYVDSFDYYEVWNTEKLNPYHFDGLNLKDTINITLYNTKENELGRSPLESTYVTSDFGLRRAEWHYGTDIRVKVGTPIYAPFDGIVRINQYERGGYGRYMVIRHKNGLETLYGHMSRTFFKVGDEVKAGEIIGYGGSTGHSTGPHLHFELRYEGNAINPNDVYDFATNTLRDSVFTITPETFAYLREARAIRRVTVRRGDTLSGLSYRYGVSINKLCRLNGISRRSILHIGQKLRIN